MIPSVYSAPRPRRTSPDTRRKTTLFCPECDHEGELEDDWRRRNGTLACPSCGTVVERR